MLIFYFTHLPKSLKVYLYFEGGELLVIRSVQGD